MPCDDISTWQAAFDALVGGRFIDGLFCQFIDPLTLAGFALLGYGMIASMIYVRTDSVAIPFVLLVLLGGGGISTQLASPALAAVAVVALVLLGGLPVVLLERYGGRG